MKNIEIIPAIDILGGKCVRLSQGDYARQTVYSADPAEVARVFEDSGISRIHVVDLDGARESHIVNYSVLERIALKTSLVIDFGGGLKSDDDLRIAFECGASMVTGGSIAVKDPVTFLGWIEKYGPRKIILGADVKEGKDCSQRLDGRIRYRHHPIYSIICSEGYSYRHFHRYCQRRNAYRTFL